jgi:chorismate mutase
MPLTSLRERIDKIDAKLTELLEERVEIAKKIGEIKKKKKLPVEDLRREDEVLLNVSQRTKQHKKFTKKIFKAIIAYCKDNER